MMTAKQAREKTDIAREINALDIREQVESVVKQVNQYTFIGRYSVLVHNDLNADVIRFLINRLGYNVAEAQSGGFIISW